jgi:hypothetical protein
MERRQRTGEMFKLGYQDRNKERMYPGHNLHNRRKPRHRPLFSQWTLPRGTSRTKIVSAKIVSHQDVAFWCRLRCFRIAYLHGQQRQKKSSSARAWRPDGYQVPRWEAYSTCAEHSAKSNPSARRAPIARISSWPFSSRAPSQ